MTQLHAVLANNLYPHSTEDQQAFIAEYVQKYQATERYGGLERTIGALVNASRGCSRTALNSPSNTGSIAGFVIGIIDHQLRVLLRKPEAYKAFAAFLAKVRAAAPMISRQAHMRLERQLNRNSKLDKDDVVAIRALEQRVFSRAA